MGLFKNASVYINTGIQARFITIRQAFQIEVPDASVTARTKTAHIFKWLYRSTIKAVINSFGDRDCTMGVGTYWCRASIWTLVRIRIRMARAVHPIAIVFFAVPLRGRSRTHNLSIEKVALIDIAG